MPNEERKKVREKLRNVMEIPKELLKSYSRITAISNEDVWIENYKSILEYDDNLIRKAMENVETKKYSLLGSKNGNELDKIAHIFGKNIAEEFIGDGQKYNCQDWASDVRKEYKKLYKELSKEEKKIIKDVEKEWKKAEKQKKIQGDNKSENTCKKNNK